jgi:RNA polymerase sigma-70 factor (ECF subfamily)
MSSLPVPIRLAMLFIPPNNSVRIRALREQLDGNGVADVPDDASLIGNARRGDRAAFGMLVERYFRAAYSSAYAVLGSAGDAEEIAQETFVQAWVKLHKLRDPGAVGGWIWRIARDTALKHIRKHGRMKPMDTVPEGQGHGGQPHEPLVEAEEKEHLLAALSKLPDDMQKVLVMKFWEDLDYDEMARRTGVTAAALYQRVCRGLKRLRQVMETPG